MPRVVLRADGSAARGLGHLVRTLALGQAFRARNVECVLVAVDDPALVLADRAGIPVERLASPEPPRTLGATLGVLERLAPDIVVVDSYELDADHRAALGSVARLLVRLDDGRGGSAPEEILVNGNVYGDAAPYEGARRSLLGPRYAPLRPAFGRVPTPPRREGVVVTMGGSDPPGATLRVLAALDGLEPARPLTVVLGPSFRHGPALETWAQGRPHLRVLRDPSVDVLRDAFVGARLAVAAAGTTMLELAACATPAVLVTIADNQLEVARAFEARGGAVRAGGIEALEERALRDVVERLLADPDRLSAMGTSLRRLVDGRGSERVVTDVLEEWAVADDVVRLRRATPEDARRVWAWRNDPVTRAQSLTTEVVPWATHEAWFAAALSDPARRLFVAEAKAGPVGVVRLDLEGTEAEVNINVAPEARGHGFGPRMLHKAVAYAEAGLGLRRVVARIKRDNAASRAAFAKAGFVQRGDGDVTRWAHERPDSPRTRAAA